MLMCDPGSKAHQVSALRWFSTTSDFRACKVGGGLARGSRNASAEKQQPSHSDSGRRAHALLQLAYMAAHLLAHQACSPPSLLLQLLQVLSQVQA